MTSKKTGERLESEVSSLLRQYCKDLLQDAQLGVDWQAGITTWHQGSYVIDQSLSRYRDGNYFQSLFQ
jgi:hypothetical protein